MSGASPTTRALWIESAGRARLREEPIAAPESGWCSVDALYSAVSPGTERLVAGGRVPPEVAESMRGPYMEGSFAFPVKYGYSLVGRVIEGSDELRGRLVHVLHPHQERCTVRISDVVPLPDGVPAARATLAANLQTAVTALWDSHITAGERALVVGFGIIGSLVARLASRMPGVELDVLDIDKDKRALAEELGFSAIDAPRGEYDLAFGASGSAEEVQTAMDALGDEGRLVELSWLGTAESRVAFGGAFHSGRKRIIGSQVSHIPPYLRGRWTLARRARLVLSLLRDPAFDRHITSTVDFEALPAFFEELCRTRSPGLSVAVRYPAA
jgi:NADPH:quinone reductase-like Zn-dependent oxidoreductase